MSERILVINKGASQQLSPDVMSHFQQVKMIVGSDQSSMPLEVVSQLLFLQSQLQMKIDFIQMQSNSDAEYYQILSFQLGLFMADPENEVAVLSEDDSIDSVIEYAKNAGFKIQRMTGTGAQVAQTKAAQPARREPEPAPQPAAPQPAAQAQPAAQPAKKDANTNKRLISTLIGGSSGLMGH